MSIRPGKHLDALPEYPMAGLKETRLRLQASGVDVIDLSVGDADLAPPPAAVEALSRAARDPAMSRYPFQLGLVAFREAVAAWMYTRFGVSVDPMTEIVPLQGSKDGIAHLPLAFMDPGDAAIIPDPGYQAYRGPVVLAGGDPHLVPLRPENDFLIPLESIPAEVLRRARILYLNHPNNPTAAVAPDAYLREAIEFCHRHDLILLHDNAYSEISFDGYLPPSILQFDGAREVAIEFHSISKTYNMTGWRLGWAAGRPELIRVLSRVKSFMDTGVFMGVQAAGVAALDSWASWVPGNVAVFQSRRDAAVAGLREAGFDVPLPRATMYLWVPVPGGGPSRDFAERALEKEGIVIIPGSALGDGGEGFFRIALTVSEERLREAAVRLGRLT
ncbi:MAG: aminotransferase class I/II-fold pyridoxal phosphate-dependent enzyme [Gemmatimonadota bacterium]|nr:aminotransferase class I/II-fold pyridoxal phosphate-dependent enzyme [Gemmatimonadota bacterium]MDH5759710.1 aminotransferase class I/II-fold pyridoxal phosphate-dependent enzyme [Gemmatimonadota bacterium]